MKLSEKMEHVGQEAYEYAPEVALLEAELAHKSRLLDVSEKAHFKTIEENAMLKREIAGLNHLIDRVYELLPGGEDEMDKRRTRT